MYIYTYIIIIILSFTICCKAQNADVVLDSLKLELENAKEAEQKVVLCIAITDCIRRSQSIKLMEMYIRQAEEIAKKAKDKKLITDVLMERGKLLSAKGQHEESEEIFKQALENYKAVDFDLGELGALNALGVIAKRQGKYVEAVNYLEAATQLLNDTLSAERKAAIYTNLSNSYSRINQFNLAYQAAFKALKYFEAAENNRGVGLVYGNIGLFYKNQGDTEKALEYYQKSIDVLEKENDLKGQYNGYGNIASLYANQGNHKESIKIRQQQLKIAEQRGSVEMIFGNKISTANEYLAVKKVDKVIDILAEVERDTGQVSNTYLITYHLIKASIFEEKKQYQKAIDMTNKAYVIGQSSGDFVNLKIVLDRLQHLHELTGDYKKAYGFLSEYQLIADSLNNQSNIQELTTQRMQFDFDKKQETFELEKEALENKLRVQQLIRWGSLGLALLVGIIAFLIFRYYKRQNELLAKDLENKKTIEAQAEQLRTFNTQLEKIVENRTKELEQANYELRTFNYIASHDIKEPIRVIGGYAGLIFKRLPNDLKENLGEYFDTIKRSTTQLYTLVEDFAYYSTLSKDETVKTEPIDLNLLAYNVIDGLQESLKKYNGEVLINNLPTINSNNTFLFTALKNLIENGLKYNKSEVPTVEINYQETESYHQIIVSDNGIGIDEKYHDRIFEMFKRLHNRGAYEGSGIGLAIVKLVTEKLGGTVKVESKVGEGTKFILNLPK
ncbi:MAG: ATP-binding protein [Saprospiraceae bacterium]